MGYVFSYHREHRIHGDSLKVFSVAKVLGKPMQLSTLPMPE